MTANTEHLKDEKVVELLKALGRAYLENGENEKAVEKFRQLVTHNADDAELLQSYAIALTRTEAVDEEALKIYSKAVNKLPDDKNLHLTLATLFLDKEVIAEPALRVFRRSLAFSPPFEDRIRTALEKIFQETTETITIPEIRQTLLDCIDNPELLSLFLATAWRDKKFDETLEVLRDLYLKSDKKPVYLEAICNTLLEKKASAEEIGQYFMLPPLYAQYCLKQQNINAPITRIRQIEPYLDYKNLFLALRRDPNAPEGQDDEYEFFLLDKSIDKLEEITETVRVPIDIKPTFNLVADLIERIRHGQQINGQDADSGPRGKLDEETNTVAIFEICNYDSDAEASKLPFETFLNLISSEMVKAHGVSLCTTEDGIVALGTNPDRMLREAIEILEKLERYNQVVEDFELIELRATIHCSPIPFHDLEYQGIREIRKAFKIHNLSQESSGSAETETRPPIRVSDEISNQVSRVKLERLGQFKLPFFPHEHVVYEVLQKVAAKAESAAPSKQYGKYEITETLKENSLGSTYRGYDPQLERPVIIKTFNTEALTQFKQFATLKKQFYEEIRNLNRISHPNISVIYDAGEKADNLYLVREFIEGETLRDFLNNRKATTAHEILDLFSRICRVLSFYHQSEVWHLNLRPDNIFLVAHNEIKLVDGGVSQLWYTEEIRIEEVDVIAYTSPEQVQRTKPDQTCDIFQLSTLLYQSLTGQNPFMADSAATVRMKILVDNPKPLSSLKPKLPKELDNLLARSFSKNPEKRHSSLQEFEAHLRKFLSNKQPQGKGRMFEVLK